MERDIAGEASRGRNVTANPTPRVGNPRLWHCRPQPVLAAQLGWRKEVRGWLGGCVWVVCGWGVGGSSHLRRSGDLAVRGFVLPLARALPLRDLVLELVGGGTVVTRPGDVTLTAARRLPRLRSVSPLEPQSSAQGSLGRLT